MLWIPESHPTQPSPHYALKKAVLFGRGPPGREVVGTVCLVFWQAVSLSCFMSHYETAANSSPGSVCLYVFSPNLTLEVQNSILKG